jgi:lysophospholipase L1-like esterase
VAALVSGLAGCGGSVDQVDPFQAKRVVVLGDELSLVQGDRGLRYGINQVSSSGIDCSALPVWTQAIAARYGFGFSECAYGGDTTGVMRAQAGAKADDLAAQIKDERFIPGDLVTLTIGLNDVIAQASLPDTSGSITTLKNAGALAASQACRVLATGAKLIVVTMPDLSRSPLSSRVNPQLLASMVDAFTGALRLGVGDCEVDGAPADGWDWGLIDGQEKIVQAASSPTLYGIVDVSNAACSDGVSPPDCTTDTLKPGASAASWLWAHEALPGPAWHRLVDAGFPNLAFAPR